MIEVPGGSWLLIWLIIGAAVLAMLGTLSAAARDEIKMHQTRAKVARLRAQYAKRLAARDGVIEVDEAPPLELPLPKAA